jgi:hypothetical protein
MGSGEFGGGGSVVWQVRYEKNDKNPHAGGPGKPVWGSGKDVDPKTEVGQKLWVFCKKARVMNIDPNPDNVVVEVTLMEDDKQVKLTWGDDITSALAELTKP